MALKPRKPPDMFRAGSVNERSTLDDEEDYFGDAASVPAAPPKKKKKKKAEPAADAEPAPEKVKKVKKAAKPDRSAAPQQVVDYDTDRKLTNKDRSRLAEWKGDSRGRAMDSFMRGQADLGRRQFGHKAVAVGGDTKNLVVGIPCPSLAFEYLIAQNCFPLGLILQVVAKYGVGKSGLVAEFGRWFDLVGGGMVLMENESKFNPFWYESIMGKEAYGRMNMYRCDSVEDWQDKLTFSLNAMQMGMTGTREAPGPGRTFPVLFGVDSIMGKQSKETQEKIFGASDVKKKRKVMGEGHATRGFPLEAQIITRYLRSVPGRLDGWPFGIVLVNHLRMGKDDDGNPIRNKSGGEQVNFQESFEIELTKVGGHKKKIQCADFEGLPLKLSCEKNSFGPTLRSIQTRVLWWDETDEDTGEWYQKTAWDWDWSTVHLLNACLSGDNANPRIKKSLKENDFHLEVTKASDIENSAWSRSLGMARSDACSWAEVGAMIREDPDLVAMLRKSLRIFDRPFMAGDYLEQLDGIKEQLP
jgi:hypothetical protein